MAAWERERLGQGLPEFGQQCWPSSLQDVHGKLQHSPDLRELPAVLCRKAAARKVMSLFMRATSSSLPFRLC